MQSPNLPRKQHKVRVQRDRQEEVAEDDGRQRPDGGEEVDAPEGRGDGGEADHAGAADDAEEEGEFELLQQLRHLFEEGRVFNLLGRRAPGHVDGEHVGEEGLADV
jgi:hypothetical protein